MRLLRLGSRKDLSLVRRLGGHAFCQLLLHQAIVQYRAGQQRLRRCNNLPIEFGSEDGFLKGAGRVVPVSHHDELVSGGLEEAQKLGQDLAVDWPLQGGAAAVLVFARGVRRSHAH